MLSSENMTCDANSCFLAIKQAILSSESHGAFRSMSYSSLMSAIMKDDFDEFNFSDYYRLQSEERASKRAATEESLRNESKKKKKLSTLNYYCE